jgi:hypothetical protein
MGRTPWQARIGEFRASHLGFLEIDRDDPGRTNQDYSENEGDLKGEGAIYGTWAWYTSLRDRAYFF